ncbi:SHOCT domain-containing protein [Thermosipho ferrireducens]|uniref:SHOCT domain-containing protein n=1 Tax=Thermosipho ferrireducens TaxID=2571116 RepID=A0ABX7S8L0_9BACT|nr:SHOCT domain-containing protein [Thermosipho ferrireducens]QTA37623.1 SHOCT domain-containing protein [Thermosipho ferrireducens]
MWAIIGVLLGVGLWFVVSKKFFSSSCCSSKKDPEQLLEEKFARGEITEEEFLNEREQLRKGGESL